jgi:hypothetical protein
MMLKARDYVQKMARRILHLPKKPAPEPAPEVGSDTAYHAPVDPLPEPQRTPLMPRMPARAAPPSEDDL